MRMQSNITVRVKDIERAIDFYVDVLGLRLMFRYKNNWATIQGPGIVIGLHPVGADEVKVFEPEKGNLAIGFQVEHLEDSLRFLSQKKVKYTTKEDNAARFAHFNDPDGTPLYFIELKYDSNAPI